MKNISLNFFGENVSIQMPTSLESLRKAISEKFMFNPSDAAEVIISYAKDLGKKIIETEQDFSNFISNQIEKLDLDISQDSRLYMENYNTLKQQNDENKKLLEECLKKDDELKAKKEKTLKEEMNKLDLIQKKIEKLNKKKMKLEKKIKREKRAIEKEQKENSQKIKNIKEKLGLIKPEPKRKLNPIKFIAKNLKAQPLKPLKTVPKEPTKKEVHPFVTCDGCQMSPIVGKRYKCKEDPNLDFCEKCFKNKSKTKGKKFEVVDTQKIMKQIILKASANRINTEGKPIHRMISCEGCGMNPIVGERFKCTVCHNFNYCKNCKDLYENMHSHPLVEIKPKLD